MIKTLFWTLGIVCLLGICLSAAAPSALQPQATTPSPLTQASNGAEYQVMLGLIISGSVISVPAVIPPAIEETPTPKIDIIQPEPAPVSRSGWSRILPPGLTCLAGMLILGMGLVMATVSRPSNLQITAVLNLSDVKPELGLVELQGRITHIPRPLDQNTEQPLAVLRLVIEESDPQGGWKVALDKLLATEFALEDGTGTVWVTPEQLEVNLLGEGAFASIKQAEEALKLLGLEPSSAWGRGLRYRLWELRKGQTLIAVGKVGQRFFLTSAPNQPLTLSPADETAQKPPAETADRHGVNKAIVLLILAGGAMLLAGAGWLVWALLR